MKKLKDLYKDRETFSKYGTAVPPISEIKATEIKELILPIAEDSAITSLPDGLSAGNVIIAYEYIDGKLTAIGASENKELLNQFDQIKQLSDDDTDDRQQKRSASIGFTVDFLDGKVICESNAQKTMQQDRAKTMVS